MISRILESVRNMWVLILALFVIAALGFSIFITSAISDGNDGDAAAAEETTSQEADPAPATSEQAEEPETEATQPENDAESEEPAEEEGPAPKEVSEEDEDGGVKASSSSGAQEESSGPTYDSGFPRVMDSVDIYDSLQRLEVAPENDDGDYDRELFPHWSASETNPACNMRWMTLYEQSPNREWYEEETCTVAEPVYWVDPYGVEDPDSGTVTHLESPDPGAFDIDHVVALEAVWASGGNSMTESQREAIANDPVNLVVTDASVNRSKGSQRADTYLPPDPQFRCEYVQRYVTIKDKYGLTVTQAEFDRLSEEWEVCS